MPLRIEATYEYLESDAKLPWYMGKAYRNGLKASVVFYVIPLNFLIGGIRNLYFTLRCGPSESRWQQALEGAYRKGQEAERYLLRERFDRLVQKISEE